MRSLRRQDHLGRRDPEGIQKIGQETEPGPQSGRAFQGGQRGSEAAQNLGNIESMSGQWVAEALMRTARRRKREDGRVGHDYQHYSSAHRGRDRRQRGRRGGAKRQIAGNTVAGAVGGIAGGSLLTSLIPMLQGAAGGVDIGAYVGQLVGGGVSGAIVSAIVGLILNRMKSG